MNEKNLLEEIKGRLDELKTTRQKFEGDWKDAQELIAPSVYSWSDLDAIPSAPKRFSSEPCKYMQTLVSGLVGYSISPSINWFSLAFEEKEFTDMYGAKDWLEDCELALVSEFNRSNLYNVVSKFVTDAMVLGHGVMLIEEDKTTGKLRFTHQRANEIYLDINAYGDVDTVFREYHLTVRQAVQLFGEDNVSSQVREDYKDPKKRGNKITVIFAVYPREEYNEEIKDAKNMPYAAVYIDSTNSHVMQISGFNEFPYSVYEFKPVTGYAYSESISKDALPDVRFLNVAKETSLKIAQTAAEPPMKASGHLKQISVVPRGLTLLESANDVLEPIRTGDNYPITLEVIQDIKNTVKEWFNVDFFLMLEAAQNKQMTATEVMEKQGEKAAILSDLIVSLNSALGQIIKRSFNLLLRSGKIPEAPQDLMERKALLKVEYEGPLAQAQKKYYSTGTIQQSLQAAAPIIQIFPESMDYIDADLLMKKTLESTGMPQSVIREDRDVEELRKERARAQAQAMQQQMQMQQAQSIMQNANKLNEPVQQGSVLDQMNQQAGEATGLNKAYE